MLLSVWLGIYLCVYLHDMCLFIRIDYNIYICSVKWEMLMYKLLHLFYFSFNISLHILSYVYCIVFVK